MRRPPGRAGRPLLIMLAMMIMVVGGLWVSPVPASAHNTLRSTDPADGAQVSRTPSSVVLTFDEPAIAMGTQLVVTGPDGPVQSGSPRLVDNTVTQELNAGAPAGAYTVAWRVTSADGHPITGEFRFTSAAAGVSSSGGASGSPGAGGASPTPATAPSVSPTVNAPAPISPQAGTPSWVWAGLVLVVVAVAGLGWWALRRRRGLRQD